MVEEQQIFLEGGRVRKSNSPLFCDIRRPKAIEVIVGQKWYDPRDGRVCGTTLNLVGGTDENCYVYVESLRLVNMATKGFSKWHYPSDYKNVQTWWVKRYNGVFNWHNNGKNSYVYPPKYFDNHFTLIDFAECIMGYELTVEQKEFLYKLSKGELCRCSWKAKRKYDIYKHQIFDLLDAYSKLPEDVLKCPWDYIEKNRVDS